MSTRELGICVVAKLDRVWVFNRFLQTRIAGILPLAGAWLLIGGIALNQPTEALAQQPQAKEQSPLVDGLLDLLNEPAPVSTPGSQNAPNQAPAPTQADNEEDQILNSSLAGHPLVLVRKNMRAAALQLNKGIVDKETHQLQADIVQRLDRLIEEMQQADPSQPSQPQSQSPRSSESQPSELSNSPRPQPADNEAANAPNQAGDGEPIGSQSSQDRPSQAGPAAGVIVDLADPERLQQDVWGQLPEQVRQQMQSRMVERFLPSYRPQIEAYFRALLESERR